jgi:hypothetical protein
MSHWGLYFELNQLSLRDNSVEKTFNSYIFLMRSFNLRKCIYFSSALTDKALWHVPIYNSYEHYESYRQLVELLGRVRQDNANTEEMRADIHV